MKKPNRKPWPSGLKFAGLWLPIEVHKKATELARNDDRSLSVFIRRLIEREVNNNHNIGENK